MKIKLRIHNPNCNIEQHGNWIDLKAAKKYQFTGLQMSSLDTRINYDFKLINLGIGMKLPKYFEANIVPRSSLFKKKKLLQVNSVGIIDSEYSGEGDIWMLPVIAFEDAIIEEGERICQFTIKASMNAPFWIKLKWLFTSKINFEIVDVLTDTDRGGFGSSG